MASPPHGESQVVGRLGGRDTGHGDDGQTQHDRGHGERGLAETADGHRHDEKQARGSEELQRENAIPEVRRHLDSLAARRAPVPDDRIRAEPSLPIVGTVRA